MPIDFDIGDGADALGRNQLSDALDGTYWVSGWDATLGTGDLEVDIAAGEGAINGGDVSTGSTQTVDFTGDVDPDDPRKAVISVDDTGTVQKTLGTAVPAAPTNEIRFRTYDPQPPTNAPGVVVAEVWLAAGATVLETVDIRDRRVSNDAVESLNTVSSFVAGGYSDVSSSRSLDTVYQNTSDNPIEVIVAMTPDADVSQFGVTFETGTSDPPGKTVDHLRVTLNNSDISNFYIDSLSATVASGSYYFIDSGATAGGGVLLQSWYEQELRVE